MTLPEGDLELGHVAHHASIHALVNDVATGLTGDTLVSSGPGTAVAAQPSHRGQSATLELVHSIPGPLVITVDDATAVVAVAASADITGLEVQGDVGAWRQLDVLLVASNAIAVDVPSHMLLGPHPASMPAGTAFPLVVSWWPDFAGTGGGPGGGETLDMTANAGNWRWTVLDQTQPPPVQLTGTTGSATPAWRWEEQIGGTWTPIAGTDGQQSILYDTEQRDGNGDLYTELQQTTTPRLRVSDDAGATWSTERDLIIDYQVTAAFDLIYQTDWSETSPLDNWTLYGSPAGGPGNNDWGRRHPDAISIHAHPTEGTVLTIEASMGTTGPEDGLLVHGGMKLRDGSSSWAFQYGRVHVRARVDKDTDEVTSGLCLLWPQTNIKGAEVNIYENYAHRDTREPIQHFLHWGDGTSQRLVESAGQATSDWHDYVMTWEPNLVSISVDGGAAQVLGTLTGEVPQELMEVALQLDAWPNPAIASPDPLNAAHQPTVTAPRRMQVSRIAVEKVAP